MWAVTRPVVICYLSSIPVTGTTLLTDSVGKSGKVQTAIEVEFGKSNQISIFTSQQDIRHIWRITVSYICQTMKYDSEWKLHIVTGNQKHRQEVMYISLSSSVSLFHEVILCASLYLSVCLCLFRPLLLSLCLSVSVCLSVSLSVGLSLSFYLILSLCAPVYLYLSPAPLLCLPRDEVMYISLSSSDSVSLSLNPSSCPSVSVCLIVLT